MFIIGATEAGGGTALGTHIPFFVGIPGREPVCICFWIWHTLTFKVNQYLIR